MHPGLEYISKLTISSITIKINRTQLRTSAKRPASFCQQNVIRVEPVDNCFFPLMISASITSEYRTSVDFDGRFHPKYILVNTL